ncbi:MAG TPA: hypothetical protein VGR87_11600 [Candidatus Limnocylindria bacterium]|jgi:hypothetical protein|nr:hypothetical protein [Candidatus Limnocylindria bacterium]
MGGLVMQRTVGIAVLIAVAAFVVLYFGIGNVQFKQGLDVEVLKANKALFAAVGAAAAFGISLILSVRGDER